MVENLQRMARQRAAQTVDEREAALVENHQAMARHRAAQTVDERETALVENRSRVQAAKARNRTKAEVKEALLSRQILEGTHKGKDLNDTEDNIGKMEHV